MNDEGNATKETFSLNPLILYGPDFKSRSLTNIKFSSSISNEVKIKMLRSRQKIRI